MDKLPTNNRSLSAVRGAPPTSTRMPPPQQHAYLYGHARPPRAAAPYLAAARAAPQGFQTASPHPSISMQQQRVPVERQQPSAAQGRPPSSLLPSSEPFEPRQPPVYPFGLAPSIWRYPEPMQPEFSYFSNSAPYVWHSTPQHQDGDASSRSVSDGIGSAPQGLRTEHQGHPTMPLEDSELATVMDIVKALDLDDEQSFQKSKSPAAESPRQAADKALDLLQQAVEEQFADAKKPDPKLELESGESRQPGSAQTRKPQHGGNDVEEDKKENKCVQGDEITEMEEELLLFQKPTRRSSDASKPRRALQEIEPPIKNDSNRNLEIVSVRGGKREVALPPPMKRFFGDANNDSKTIVIGLPTNAEYADQLINERLNQLRQVANDGYGIVPITNSFTIRNSQTRTIERKGSLSAEQIAVTPPSSPEADENADDLDLTQPNRKRSSKNVAPPSPSLPTDEELRTKKLVLYQVGFASGRQGIFQGLSTARNNERLEDLIGSWVVLNQDDGSDIGLLRAIEPLDALIGRIPEAPFMRILRRAREKEIELLQKKSKEEAYMVDTARGILKSRPSMGRNMAVRYCEFQADKNKLIVYADLKQYVVFNEFVKALHAACESDFGYQARIFVQRRFVD